MNANRRSATIKNFSALRSFGLGLRKLREAEKLTQEKLAEKAELDATYISGIENGRRNPSLLTLGRIAQGLGKQISDITYPL